MSEREELETALSDANQLIASGEATNVSPKIRKDIDLLIEKIGSNKSIVSALATSLLKKIIEPKQDVRLHRTDFENGYSARSLDTRITSPFFKEHFPKYANKESSFLTLATREKIKWNKENGVNLKIRSKKLKESFLNVFEQIEEYNQNPKTYLIYLFANLIELSKQDELIFKLAKEDSKDISTINIQIVLEMLQKHFAIKLSSRLPVVAIYSIYEILLPKFERFKNKKLLPLQVHTSSDKHGFGDIEIYDEAENPFEIIEIKHNIPIDKYLIFDIVKKIEKVEIDRYYILTTYKNGFENAKTEKEVSEYILEIKRQKGFDIIANGILTTLKYYLRFIDNYNSFIEIYTKNLITDAENSTAVKSFHIEEWSKILEFYKIGNE